MDSNAKDINQLNLSATNEHCFIYFGALTPMAKVYNCMNEHGEEDVYVWLCEHNLQYRRIGKIRTNWQIIAGREIRFLKNDNPYNLDLDRPYQQLDENDLKRYKLNINVERDITWNLSRAGIHQVPRYYIIYNKLIEIPVVIQEKPKMIALR